MVCAFEPFAAVLICIVYNSYLVALETVVQDLDNCGVLFVKLDDMAQEKLSNFLLSLLLID